MKASSGSHTTMSSETALHTQIDRTEASMRTNLAEIGKNSTPQGPGPRDHASEKSWGFCFCWVGDCEPLPGDPLALNLSGTAMSVVLLSIAGRRQHLICQERPGA